eukprot:g2251.t1
MSSSTIIVVLLSAVVFVSQVACHESCDISSDYDYTIRTPEECAAACSEYKGSKGDCFAWMAQLGGGTPCSLHFIKRQVSFGDGDYCGVNPVPSVMKSKDPDSNEAPGSEEAPSGCYVYTSTTDLGYASTKEECESSCLGLKSKRYNECLVWIWDEEDKNCKGILVEDSSFYACGTPATMPL